MPAGRPSEYSEDLADKICELIAEPKTLLEICEMDDMPSQSMVYRWLDKHKEFREKYAKAREVQADMFADQIIKVAFDTQGDTYADEFGNPKPNHEWINRSRLKVDALKWKAAKTAPKKYGDKVEQTIVGDPEKPVHHTHDLSKSSYDELMEIVKQNREQK
jgi:hypothetical protein